MTAAHQVYTLDIGAAKKPPSLSVRSSVERSSAKNFPFGMPTRIWSESLDWSYTGGEFSSNLSSGTTTITLPTTFHCLAINSASGGRSRGWRSSSFGPCGHDSMFRKHNLGCDTWAQWIAMVSVQFQEIILKRQTYLSRHVTRHCSLICQLSIYPWRTSQGPGIGLPR